MISVKMSELWGNDVEKAVKGITEATDNIALYHNCSNTTQDMLLELREDISEIFHIWAGSTYIGCPKTEPIKMAFQSFFDELMRLLLDMKESRKNYEQALANALLYRGKVYRYLGSDHPTDTVVKPVCDSIYVSWSKQPQNSYIERKLYGTITWVSCDIKAPFYGIDLDEFDCSRGNEHEVIFPTIEECITEIKYFSEESNDETGTTDK